LKPDGFDIETTHHAGQAQPCPDRPFGIILMGSRVAEIDQYGVAHKAGDETIEPRNDPGDGVVITGDDLAQVFGIKACS
jgi:hypothetical protein